MRLDHLLSRELLVNIATLKSVERYVGFAGLISLLIHGGTGFWQDINLARIQLDRQVHALPGRSDLLFKKQRELFSTLQLSGG